MVDDTDGGESHESDMSNNDWTLRMAEQRQV